MDMDFVAANAKVPSGKVVTSARKSDKWFNAVKPGDVVFLRVTESKAVFGRAAVVSTELTTYAKVIETASDNIEASNLQDGETPASRLANALKLGYGEGLQDDEPFTKVGIIRLND